jgi:5'-nucleotidase
VSEPAPKRILVTNDDGIDSPGLHAVVEALAPLATVVVVAPDRNRSAVSRSITLGQTLQVVEQEVPGAELALATDGTPTDCVRLAALGLAGPPPDLVVSGANMGLNLGDDVTYSGTVAAAFEGAINGVPAVAVSQQSIHRELGYPRTREYEYGAMQVFIRAFVAHLLDQLDRLPANLVVSVNVPGCNLEDVAGVEVGRLGRRIYRDKLELQREEGDRRHYLLYGDDPSHHEEEGTDIAAIGRGCIAVTPLRFQLADSDAASAISTWPFDEFLKGDTA